MRPLRRDFSAFACLALVLAGPGAAAAQSDTGLAPRQLLIRITSPTGTATGVSNIGEAIADLVGLEVSTAPLGSTAGGFTFTFDPVTREFSRAAPSFGPMFGERAITAGEGGANFGLTFLHRTYDTLDGTDIRDGSIETVVLSGADAPLHRGTLAMDVTTDTVVLFGNVSLNGWFDAGVALPYIRLRIDGRHQVGEQAATGAAAASGLGDAALRAKIRIIAREHGGFSIGLDAHLPTGDRESLLGAGVTRTLVSGIWSGTFRTLAPHASLGFEYWSDPFQMFDPLQRSTVEAGRHALVYTGGVEWPATDRLTVNGELGGRALFEGGRLAHRTIPLRENPFDLTQASIATIDPRGLYRIAASTGVKWNPTGTLLLAASILMPLNAAGLRDRVTPVLGLDWGF